MDDEENREHSEQSEPEEDEAKGVLTLVPLQVSQADFQGDLLVVAMLLVVPNSSDDGPLIRELEHLKQQGLILEFTLS